MSDKSDSKLVTAHGSVWSKTKFRDWSVEMDEEKEVIILQNAAGNDCLRVMTQDMIQFLWNNGFKVTNAN